MIEPAFHDELALLKGALKQENFRFILIGHNHRSIYLDIKNWLSEQFPDRHLAEVIFRDKSYRQISDELSTIEKGIILIPDFDVLFRKENTAALVALNQRRDHFAKKPLAFLCFIQPSNFLKVPQKIPDWWSLRSLELEFEREVASEGFLELIPINESSSFTDLPLVGKETELMRLLDQLAVADPNNKVLLGNLNARIGQLYFYLGMYADALMYLEAGLNISKELKNQEEEISILNALGQVYYMGGDLNKAKYYFENSLYLSDNLNNPQIKISILNNIGLVFWKKYEYEKARDFFEQSLKSSQKTNYLQGENSALNNIGLIYEAERKYDKARKYFEKSLNIQRVIGDRLNEAATLNNIGETYLAQGHNDEAIYFFEKSFEISQELGDARGGGITLNNISQVYKNKRDYKLALNYLNKSLAISQKINDKLGEAVVLHNIGYLYFTQELYEEALPFFALAFKIGIQLSSPKAKITEKYLNAILSSLGEARYQEIISQIEE